MRGSQGLSYKGVTLCMTHVMTPPADSLLGPAWEPNV